MTTDTLNQLRGLARARALESFDFFANTVLGAKLDSAFCDSVQKSIERGESVEFDPFRGRIVRAWLTVLGREGKLPKAPTETFSWLFHDYVARDSEAA